MFELAPRLRHNPSNRKAFHETTVTLACPVCTEGVAFVPKATAVTCERCLTPLLRGPDDDQPLPPTAILPFRIAEAGADAALRARVSEARDPRYIVTWTRLYVPYWSFAIHVKAPWRHQSSSYDSSTESYDTETLEGEFEDDLDYRFPAARLDEAKGLIDSWQPPTLADAMPFEPALVDNVAVQPVTVGLETAWERVRGRVDARVEKGVKEAAGLWSGLPDEWVTDRTREQAALVLVPVYVGVGGDGAAERFLLDGYTGNAFAATCAQSRSSRSRGRKPEVSPVLGLLVLGALAALALLLLWAVFAAGRALLATRM